ncbi:MAG: hypothetical protein ACREDI_07145, partial [Roseiarcus sp.]
RFEVSVRLAGAAEPPDGARLTWRFSDESGDAALGPDPTTIALSPGAAGAIAIVPLELEARDVGGRLLSRNALELCVVPPLGGAAPSLFPIDGAASSALAAIGWPNRAATVEEAEIVLATRLRPRSARRSSPAARLCSSPIPRMRCSTRNGSCRLATGTTFPRCC